jgi:hypothetical protein
MTVVAAVTVLVIPGGPMARVTLLVVTLLVVTMVVVIVMVVMVVMVATSNFFPREQLGSTKIRSLSIRDSITT